MKNLFPIFLIMLLSACHFSKSYSTDAKLGLTTSGDGLHCEDVFLAINGQKVERNAFIYGEKVEVNLNNIQGFELKNGAAFPGMKMTITDKKGKVLLSENDLFADYKSGYSEKPMKLSAMFPALNPNGSYTLKLHTWDKKGKGTFDVTLEFTVKTNESLKHESNGISFDQVYLFDQDNRVTLASDIVPSNRQIFLLYEGLKGFASENGISKIGLSMNAKDASGRMFIQEPDLFAANPEIKSEELAAQLAPNFIFRNVSSANLKNPVRMEVVIWDKLAKGRRIRTTIDLNVVLQ